MSNNEEIIDVPKPLVKPVEKTEAEKLAEAGREEKNTMPYNTASSCTPLGVSVPTKMYIETEAALYKSFKGKGEDSADFVKIKLGYSSRLPVCKAFAAEQCDAVALTIKQIERDKGFILGDMAGTGKGRVCAGIVRYAIQNGKIPVFVTYKSSLFSDIYRDFDAIGGTGEKDGKGVNKKMPIPFIFNSDTDSFVKKIEKQEDGSELMVVLHKPFSTAKVIEICKEGKMPEDMDVILMTYSQLQAKLEKGGNVKDKFDFLSAISPNCIFVFDESHKAAGDGAGSENWAKLLTTAGGVMFSSATFAKTPTSMLLYISKTDIADSNINPSTIVDAVAENGEAVQEYIASALVRSGQMLRRERTYEKCKISYDYIKKDVDKYYEIYDKITTIYNNIENYCKEKNYIEALVNARIRIAKENNVELVAEDDKKPEIKSPEYIAWINKNQFNYQMSFDTTKSVRNRFPFIESLLFSIKADFVVENVLNALSKKTIQNPETGIEEPAMYEYMIGDTVSMVNTNTKPVIAVRSTNQSMLENLGYKVGQILSEDEFDFTKSLSTITQRLLVAKCSLSPAVPNMEDDYKDSFKYTANKLVSYEGKIYRSQQGSKGVLPTDLEKWDYVEEAREKIEIEDCRILDSDFPDGGSSYLALLLSVNMEKSGLKLSPLDYIKEKIASVTRQPWDYDYSSKANYTTEEVTGRTIGVRQLLDEFNKPVFPIAYEVYKIKKESTMDRVARFNSGESDVIILNTSGSTGLSLHSEIGFKDRRPRNMFMHQVQLDIAIEVQMRGRVNRTGQINYPSYTYLVSCVPSEVRKLLMLRKKLRSLDANTTGNVRQSAKASKVVDRKGVEVEDMTNHYGWGLLREYVKNEKAIYELMTAKFWTLTDRPEERFSDVLLEIEKLMCADQERFYDELNEQFISLKKEKVENQEWDLETSMDDLNASTENKKYLYIGNDENEFTKSVFIEDKFSNPKSKPMKSLVEVNSRMVKLADGEDNFTKRQNDLLIDFEKYKKEEREELLMSLGTPDTEGKTEAQKAKILLDFKEKLDKNILNQEYKFSQVGIRFKKYKIGSYYMIPDDPTTLTWTLPYDSDGKKIALPKTPAIFMGFKIPTKSEIFHRFNPMAVELQFASPRKTIPYLAASCTVSNKNLLDWIEEAIDEKRRDELGLKEDAINASSADISDLAKWRVVKSDGRVKMRVLTGELFKALELAKSLIIDKKDQYADKKRLIKYSTTAGTIETGVKMFSKYFSFKTLVDSITPLYVPVNSDEFVKFVKDKHSVVWLQGFKDAIIYNQFQDVFTLFICTGKEKKKKGIAPAYVSALSKPETVTAIENIVHKGKILFDWTVEMYATGSSARVNKEFYKFEMKENAFKKVLDFIYKDFSFKQEIESQKEFILSGLEDMAKSESEKYKRGEYEYYPTKPFQVESAPANYIKDSYSSAPDSQYGIIKLYYPLTPFEASVLRFIPAHLTESKGVRNVLDSLEEGKAKYEWISKVKELAKGLSDDATENKWIYIDIANFTEEKIMFNPQYAIGKVFVWRLGRIIAENIDNPSPPEEEEIIIQAEEDEKEILPLTLETAQDFIIKFKSL